MLDFLLESNIKQSTIDTLNKNCSDSIQYSLNCNEYEIKKIITYLKKIGINCIDEILIDYYEFFLSSYDDFKNRFKKYKLEPLVELINADYNNVFSQFIELDSNY